jgi:hypothetical protein
MRDSYARVTEGVSGRKKPPDRRSLPAKSVLSSLNPSFKFEEKPVSPFSNIIIANFTNITTSLKDIVNTLRNKFENRIITFRKCKRPNYYEIILRKDVDIGKILQEGLYFNDIKVPLFRTVRPLTNTLLVTLKNTPLLEERELAMVLEEKLGEFGVLKDLRLLYIPDSDWVSGTAQAFFDLELSPDVEKRLPTKLDLQDTYGRSTLLFWKGSPKTCNKCKKPGHIVANCPWRIQFDIKRHNDSRDSVHAPLLEMRQSPAHDIIPQVDGNFENVTQPQSVNITLEQQPEPSQTKWSDKNSIYDNTSEMSDEIMVDKVDSSALTNNIDTSSHSNISKNSTSKRNISRKNLKPTRRSSRLAEKTSTQNEIINIDTVTSMDFQPTDNSSSSSTDAMNCSDDPNNSPFISNYNVQ